MKTNLDGIYKTDKDLESNGVWFDISETAGFLVKRFGGKNAAEMKKIHAKHFKKYARQIQQGALPAEKEEELSVRVFVECCVIDWRGIEIDGEKVEFSKEKCIDLLLELPDLAEALVAYATDKDCYKEELGNS